MVVTHRSPRSPFDGAVLLWACHAPELPDRLERSLPDGRVSIYVNLAEDQIRWYAGTRCHRLAGSSLGGARAHAYAIDTREQRHVVGATFTPGAARAFFDLPLDALAGQHVALSEVWGREATLLRERLLEAPTDTMRLAVFESVLRARCVHAHLRDPAIDFAIRCFDDTGRRWSIAEVTEKVGLGTRAFIRHFAERVGLTPKRYARVRRFQRTLAALATQPKPLTTIAADCGYFDQAHFIHDFRSFAGLTPSQFVASGGTGNHVRIDDARIYNPRGAGRRIVAP